MRYGQNKTTTDANCLIGTICTYNDIIVTLKVVMENIMESSKDHERRLRIIERVLYIGIGGLYVIQGIIFFK